MLRLDLNKNESTNFRGHLGTNFINLNIIYEKFYDAYYVQILQENDELRESIKILNNRIVLFILESRISLIRQGNMLTLKAT